MRLLCLVRVQAQKLTIVRFHLGELRLRHEQVAAGIADLALHVPLLVPRVRIAETDGEAVVRPHPSEQRGLVDDLANPSPDPVALSNTMTGDTPPR